MTEPTEIVEAEADSPPWEQPGAVRLECGPHRGSHLGSAGRLGHAMAVLSMALPVLAIPAWVLIIFVLVGARRDMDLMNEGRMDPDGYATTWEGRRSAL